MGSRMIRAVGVVGAASAVIAAALLAPSGAFASTSAPSPAVSPSVGHAIAPAAATPPRFKVQPHAASSRALHADAGTLAPATASPADASITPSGFDPTTTRVVGADRFATSVQLAQSQYSSGAPIVFVATGFNYPDALAAGPVAAEKGGPLLLTEPNMLPSEVGSEIQALNPSTIVIVGGTAAVDPSVASALQSLVPAASVIREAGADRFATAEAIDGYGFAHGASSIYVATGDNYPDALSAAAAAGAHHEPVVLVNGSESTLDQPTQAYIAGLGATKAVVAGGTSAVSSGVVAGIATAVGGSANVTQLAGADRFATSQLVSAQAFTSASTAYLATGFNYPDALAGSAIAGHADAPLLTVQPTCVPLETLGELSTLGVSTVTLIGGTSALSEDVANLTPCGVNVTATAAVGPNANQALNLTAVDCSSQGSCVAVGAAGTDTDSVGMIDTLRNGTWTLQTAPEPAGDGIYGLNGVTCTSDTACTAVGYLVDSNTLSQPLVETYNGTTWTAAELTLPSNAATSHPGGDTSTFDAGSLYSVDCSAAGSCVATGAYEDTNQVAHGLVETLASGTWTPSEVVTPLGNEVGSTPLESTINAEGCAPGGTCYLVGTTDAASDPSLASDQATFIDTLTGSTWSTENAPVPSNAASDPQTQLDSIDCSTASNCVSVGNYNLSATTATPLVETLASGSWQPLQVTQPNGGLANYPVANLDSVSCASATSCSASGFEVDGSGVQMAFVSRLDDGAWTSVQAPLPAGSTSTPNDGAALWTTSCGSLGVCVSEGDYSASGQNGSGLTAVHLGSNLADSPVLIPTANTEPGYIGVDEAVSCAGNECVAVGNFQDDSAQGTDGLIDTYTW